MKKILFTHLTSNKIELIQKQIIFIVSVCTLLIATNVMANNCVSIKDDLTLSILCAEYEGVTFSFSLVKYDDPEAENPSELLWRLGSLSIFDDAKLSENIACESPLLVPSDLNIAIECADYYGTHIKFRLLPYYRQSDIENSGSELLWILDNESIEILNDGIWQSKGYGRIFEIKGGKFTLFDYTQTSLLPDMQGEIEGEQVYILGGYLLGKFSNGSFRFQGSSVDYEFTRIEKLPEVEITSSTDDPTSNFEVFWHTIEEQCSLFNLIDVDWHSVYEDYKGKISASTTAQELFELLAEMIKMLNDPHTFLYAPELNIGIASSDEPPFWSFLQENSENYKSTIISYLDKENFDPQINITADGNIAYGIIDKSHGYLAVNSFAGYSDTGSVVDEKEIFSAIIDNAITFFKSQNINSIIIDLRANEGGYDELALALGKRFTGSQIKVYSKQYRDGGYSDFSDDTEFIINPEGNSLVNLPIAVLTSSMTVSASEVATLIFKALPKTTIIGETTQGAFSDILEKTLPNGWKLGLSNERYKSFDGKDYEQTGILPDVEIIMAQEDLDSGRDRFIEAAIDNLDSTVSKFQAILAAVTKDLENNYATAASVAVWIDGKIIWIGGFSDSNAEERQINEDTQFMIGSDTKKITAISLLRKVASGKVNLEDKVSDILPDLIMEKAALFTKSTIHDLLSMQGGISDGGENTSNTSDNALYDYAYNTFAKEYVSLAPPARFWNYSNPNYSIAGLIDQTIDSRAWADIVTEDIFLPLKMSRTVARKSEVDENHCAGFSISQSESEFPIKISLEETWETAFTRPAGLVWSTPSDQMRLAKFIVEGNPNIIDTTYLRKISQEQVLIYPDMPGAYGYGLFVDQGLYIDNLWYDIPVWRHGGNTDTHTSTFFILPEQKFAISILSNGEGDDFTQSVIAAIKTLVTLPAPSVPPQPPMVDTSKLDELTGTYIDSNIFGELIVSREGDTLLISIPALDIEEIAYEKEMEPISTRVWFAKIDDVYMNATFIDGPDGEIYLRNREAVFIRWQEGEGWQTVKQRSNGQIQKSLDAMRYKRSL